jgi:hypothetical protein
VGAGARHPDTSLAANFSVGRFLPFGIVDDFEDGAISPVGLVRALVPRTQRAIAEKEIEDG